MLYHSAKPRFAFNTTGILILFIFQRFVVHSGVRALGVVVIDIFPNQVFKVLFSEYIEMIQTLAFDGSYKPFGRWVKVGRAVRYFLDVGVKGLEYFIKFL